MTHTTHTPVPSRRRGSGTQRQRRPGVREVRVPVVPHPVTGQRRQRSVTVHGTEADATARRVLLATAQPRTQSAPQTVGRLLGVWLEADHPWKPASVVSHHWVARALRADRIPLRVKPELVAHAPNQC